MYKAWESKIKTPRDIVLFQRLKETVLFTYFKKPACKFDRTYCKEIFLPGKRTNCLERDEPSSSAPAPSSSAPASSSSAPATSSSALAPRQKRTLRNSQK